jgi:hypothetical protein
VLFSPTTKSASLPFEDGTANVLRRDGVRRGSAEQFRNFGQTSGSVARYLLRQREGTRR